jgi:hypothetical protein
LRALVDALDELTKLLLDLVEASVLLAKLLLHFVEASVYFVEAALLLAKLLLHFVEASVHFVEMRVLVNELLLDLFEATILLVKSASLLLYFRHDGGRVPRQTEGRREYSDKQCRNERASPPDEAELGLKHCNGGLNHCNRGLNACNSRLYVLDFPADLAVRLAEVSDILGEKLGRSGRWHAISFAFMAIFDSLPFCDKTGD